MAKGKQDTFAARLAALRKRAGISQYRLAQLSGVSKQALSQLEAGTSQPSWETVRALARGLGVEVGAFDTGAGEPVAAEPAGPRGRPPKAMPATPPASELEAAHEDHRDRPHETTGPMEGLPPIPELPARHDVPGTATPSKPRGRPRKGA